MVRAMIRQKEQYTVPTTEELLAQSKVGTEVIQRVLEEKSRKEAEEREAVAKRTAELPKMPRRARRNKR